MLSDVRIPKQGDEVQFADGSTAVIKQFVRSRVLDGHPAYVVEMAKPCRYEYVTLVAFLTSGFWQAVTTIAASPAEQSTVDTLSADQRYEAQFDDVAVKGYDVHPVRHEWRALAPMMAVVFCAGMVAGLLLAWLS